MDGKSLKSIEKMNEVKMELIMRSQGSGYLKVPSVVRNTIRNTHGKEIKELASPNLFYDITDDELLLAYRFDLTKEPKTNKDDYV